MNLPFRLPDVMSIGGKKKEEVSEAAVMYEHKLAEYRDALEYYKKWLLEYARNMEGTQRPAKDSSLTDIQTVLDLTYLKEQGEKNLERMEELNQGALDRLLSELEFIKVNLADADSQLESLDRNVVNRLSELLIELQKQMNLQNKEYQADLITKVELLQERVKKGQALLWFLLISNLIGVSGIAFIVLYILELLPF
jgi:DNA repair exonuclease SbcCD ATPase subunit